MGQRHSLFFAEILDAEPARAKTAEEVAFERWDLRQTRLAEAVGRTLQSLHGQNGWTWTVTNDFFGRTIDTEILVGTSPNGDGTTSGIVMAGDFSILAEIMGNIHQEEQEHARSLDWFYNGLTKEDDMNKEQFEEVLSFMRKFAEAQEKRDAEINTILDAIYSQTNVGKVFPEGGAQAPKEEDHRGFAGRLKSSWDVILIIGSMVGVGWLGASHISSENAKALAPVEQRLEKIDITLNGTLGTPGVLTQLQLIQAEMKSQNNSATSVNSRSSTPPTAIDGSPMP